MNTASSTGTLAVQYNFYTLPDEMAVYNQGGVLIFDSGMVSGSGVFNIAYTNSSVLTIVMNPFGNPSPGTLWDYTINTAQGYTTYLVLTEDTNKTTTPIKFAPTPFYGIANLTTITNPPVIITNPAVITTNYATTNNYYPVPNEAVGWHSSFESGSGPAGGWVLNSGNALVLSTGYSGSTAFEGNYYLDISGTTTLGNISTNVSTVIGQTYLLSFAYSKNPVGGAHAVQLLANGSPLLAISVTTNNSWPNLGWATTSVLFTATSTTTIITFATLTPDPYGVLLDAIDLAPLNVGSDGFEGATAGDYAQGHFFDGWYVNSNQVTVIFNPALANEGNQLLALADGTISRILPTIPGSNYILSFAYRGPGAVSLWRGENNANDSIGANNPATVQNITYTAGEIGQAMVFNGTNSYIQYPASGSLNVGTNSSGFTLDAWLFLVNTQYLESMFEWNTGSGTGDGPVGLQFAVAPYNGQVDGDLNANLEDTTTAFHNFNSVGTLVSYGSFQHVALTYDRISGNAVIYRNGVVVANANLGNSFTTQTTFPLYLGWRAAGNFVSPASNALQGDLDEPTIYNRPLSASEIIAIYNQGTNHAAKYDLTAPTIAQGLAEAMGTVGTNAIPLFYGNNNNWQTNTITFMATQSNMVLQVAGLEPGMLLDNFLLTNVVYVTNISGYTTNLPTYTTNAPTYTTNTSGGDVYYLPEQSLDTFKGVNAYGQWQLEVWDNRVGAGLTNTLVNWQLRFNFASSLSSVGVLTNEVPVTNVIPAGGMEYYLVIVPTNADFATNRLLFASGPLNVWFNPATLPVGTNPPDYLLLPNSTGGHSILSLTSMPTNIVPGGTYYLAVQNTGASAVTYGIEVDFRLVFPPVPPAIGTQVINELTLLTVTNTGTSGHPPLNYSVSISVDTNAMLLLGWPLLYAGPSPAPVISPTGIITWTPSEYQDRGLHHHHGHHRQQPAAVKHDQQFHRDRERGEHAAVLFEHTDQSEHRRAFHAHREQRGRRFGHPAQSAVLLADQPAGRHDH